MITDVETNILYFSSLLTELERYKPFWNRLKPILVENNIEFRLIENTRSIWCRDYMPVQIEDDEFVQFTYFPNYLLKPEHISKMTFQEEINVAFKGNVKKSKLIIDGGNIVKYKDKIVVTEKIYDDNSNLLPSTIEEKLRNSLQIEDIFIIPKLAFDYTGHADGMVKFLNDNQLLVADYSHTNQSWKKKMKIALSWIEKSEIEILPFPNVEVTEKNSDGDYTAKGVYINFVQIGNIILFPQFGLNDDKAALKSVIKIYKGTNIKIVPVLCNEIAREGGVLNCISWNIKQ